MRFIFTDKEKNNDFEANFLALNTTIVNDNFSFLTQIYGLDLENTYGVSETITYKISKQIDLRGFVNKTLSNGNLNWTLGTRYNL